MAQSHPSQGSDSDSDEDSSEVRIAPREINDASDDDSSSSSGPAVREGDEGKTEEDTDTDEDEDGDVKDQRGFTNNGEPEFKPKKVKLAKICIIFKTYLHDTHIHITHSEAHVTQKMDLCKNHSKCKTDRDCSGIKG